MGQNAINKTCKLGKEKLIVLLGINIKQCIAMYTQLFHSGPFNAMQNHFNVKAPPPFISILLLHPTLLIITIIELLSRCLVNVWVAERPLINRNNIKCTAFDRTRKAQSQDSNLVRWTTVFNHPHGIGKC